MPLASARAVSELLQQLQITNASKKNVYISDKTSIAKERKKIMKDTNVSLKHSLEMLRRH